MTDKGGRPRKDTDELLEKAKEYVNGGWADVDAVPSIAGLADHLDVSRETLRLWGNDPDSKFFGTLEKVGTKQERELINGGLLGRYSQPIAKMLLHGHGHSDKVEQDITSGGEKMAPAVIERVIVRPKDSDAD